MASVQGVMVIDILWFIVAVCSIAIIAALAQAIWPTAPKVKIVTAEDVAEMSEEEFLSGEWKHLDDLKEDGKDVDMSMNLQLICQVQVEATNRKGKKILKPEIISFNLYQTPTAVTYRILKEKDQLAAYIEWVKGTFDNQEKKHADKPKYWDAGVQAFVEIEIESNIQQHIGEVIHWVKEQEMNGYRPTWVGI